MADQRLKLDPNGRNILGAIDDVTGDIVALEVDNATGRLKVDASVTVEGDVGALDQLDLTNSNPLTVAIVDTNGDQIASFGGGTQYTEGDTDASITGTALMMEGAGNTLVAAPGTAADGLLVNLGSNNDVSLNAGTNAIGKLAANSGVDIGDVDVLTVPTDPFGANADAASATGSISAKLRRLATDLSAVVSGSELQVDVVGALPAGTNAIGKLAANSGVDIGDVDVTSISAGTNTIGNVGLIGRTSGGLTPFKSLDIDETEEDVKTSAGQLFSIIAMNRTAAPLYLKFYNATAANVTVGTTTPVLTIPVPANADSDVAGFVWNNEIGFAFSTAISVACTTGFADNDTGAPGTNDCIINLGYT